MSLEVFGNVVKFAILHEAGRFHEDEILPISISPVFGSNFKQRSFQASACLKKWKLRISWRNKIIKIYGYLRLQNTLRVLLLLNFFFLSKERSL